MAQEDQDFRLQWFEHRDDAGWREKMAFMDHRLTAELKEIVQQIGWPTIDKVGARASHAAWLLVQHAAQEPEFQHRCLELMESAHPETIDRRGIAYLSDKLAVGEGRSQKFGTQYQASSSDMLPLFPLENPDQVGALRAAYGLGPLKPFYDVAAEEKNEKQGTNFSSLDGYKKESEA